MTQCTTQCIGKIRLNGFKSADYDKIMSKQVRENNPIDFLVHVRKIALPIYPQFGTEPSNMYLPPVMLTLISCPKYLALALKTP